MSNMESNANVSGGYGGGAGGSAGRVIEKNPPKKSPNAQRKTVTFGDGSAVTGNRMISLVTLVVLFIIW